MTEATLPIKQAASEFLVQRRVAVTGVSRRPQGHGSNVVYRRFRGRGYDVFPVNPNSEEVEGDHSYPDLHSIPGGVDAVVIGTRPERALETMHECVDLGVNYVWMHSPAFGDGSVSHEAAVFGRDHGIQVIEGGCPCMFGPTADIGHRLMRHTPGGQVPKKV
jgi:predicted CoA-binding protein